MSAFNDWYRLRTTPADAVDGGFTMVEVIVAFAIFMTVAAAATFSVVIGQTTSRTTNNRVTGTSIAQQAIDQARAMPRAELTAAPNSTTTTAPVGGKDFQVTRTVGYLPAGSPATTSCPTAPPTTAPQPGADAPAITVEVQVTPPGDPDRVIRMDTVIAC